MIQDAKFFGQDVFLVTMYIKDPKGNPMQFVAPLTGRESPAYMHKLVHSTYGDLVGAFDKHFKDFLINQAQRIYNQNAYVGPNSKW